MKKFALLFLVLVFAGRGVYAQFTQAEFVNEWKRAKVYTKEYLDAMPADGYSFKPTPEIRSYAQQMQHLADVNYFFAATAAGKKGPEGSLEKGPATKEAVTKAVMESYDFAIAALEGLKPAQLNEKVKVEGQELSRFNAFGKAFEHQTHHRGQCVIYLRMHKITPPQEKLF